MAIDSFDSAVDGLLADAQASLQSVDSFDALEAFRIQFTGAKNGALKSLQKLLGAVPPEHKPAAGKRFNQARETIEQLLTEATEKVSKASSGKPISSTGPLVDPTLPGLRPRIGVLHPITQTLEHLKEIMGRLGFNVTEGPEIEDEWHNFVALNIPEDHPARDPLDNFYLATAKTNLPKASTDTQSSGNSSGGDIAARLLRSQTSTVRNGVHSVAPKNHLARSRLPPGCTRRHPLPNVPSDGRSLGRQECNDGSAKKRFAVIRHQLSRWRCQRSLPPIVLPIHRTKRRSGLLVERAVD